MVVQRVAGNLMSPVQIPDVRQNLTPDRKPVFIIPDKILQTGIQIEGSFDSVPV
jgi:hypothetical protein